MADISMIPRWMLLHKYISQSKNGTPDFTGRSVFLYHFKEKGRFSLIAHEEVRRFEALCVLF